MAKKNKALDFVVWLAMVMTSIAMGELFLNGTFEAGTLVLSYFPAIIHDIVGYVLLGSGVWTLISKFWN